MLASLEACPALVLNADFRPLSYFPLSLWSWQDAIKAVFLDRVNIVSEYKRQVHSPSLSMRLPSVVSLKQYIPATRRPATRPTARPTESFSRSRPGARRRPKPGTGSRALCPLRRFHGQDRGGYGR